MTTTLPDSLWQATATAAHPYPTLDESITADVTIVGAGFTGLSAALHLSEMGYNVCLLEAVEVGFGASGRNGGQVIPGIKLQPAEILKRFGQEQGEGVIRSTNESAKLVYQLIEKHDINCDLRKNGYIQLAFSKQSLTALQQRLEIHKQYDAPLRLLDADETSEILGTQDYIGGLLDADGGGLQPLSYARGLAEAAHKQGAQIYQHSPLTSLKSQGEHWLATSNSGEVRSKYVLLCTNGYGNLAGRKNNWPGLADSVIPLYSFQAATTPLPKELRAEILPHDHVVADTRRLLNYFRLDAEGRLIMGGRGGVNDARSQNDYSHITARLHEIYPQLAVQPFEYYWSGRVAITLDHAPHLHQLAPTVFAAQGYNGRGVGMATLTGKWLADIVNGSGNELERLPITPMKPIPFMRFRKPIIQMVSSFKGVLDRFER